MKSSLTFDIFSSQ